MKTCPFYFRQLGYWCFLLVLTLSSCGTNRTATSIPPVAPLEFTILQINDVYEINPLEGGKVGGLARVATLLKQLKAENPNTIAILAGDFLSPSFMTNLRMADGKKVAGLQMIETLNAMGLDYATFGNHEFDIKSLDLLEERINQSEFEYNSCNARRVKDGVTSRFVQNGAAVPDYNLHRFQYKDGQELSVALIGVVLPFNQMSYVAYLDVEDSFGKAIKAAEQSAEVVLGMTHLTVKGDEALAVAQPGLPLFMGGHDHDQMSRYVEQTAITKADANAKTAYVHRFKYYPRTQVTQLRSTVVPITAELAADPATQQVIDKWNAFEVDLIRDLGYDPAETLMEVKTPLEGTEVAIRSRQTNYGRLTNEAIAYHWPDADAYLFNSGSLRLDDNLLGTVTAYDVLRTYPYGGPLVRMEIRGEDLQRLLDIGSTTNKGKGGYLQLFRVSKEGGNWVIDGKAITPDQGYVIVLPEFLAKGREANLEFLGDYQYLSQETFKGSGGAVVENDIRNVLIAYMRHLGVFE